MQAHIAGEEDRPARIEPSYRQRSTYPLLAKLFFFLLLKNGPPIAHFLDFFLCVRAYTLFPLWATRDLDEIRLGGFAVRQIRL